MFATSTPAALRAVDAAERRARLENAEQIESRHLVLGLLEEEEGRVASLLTSAGLDLRGFRDPFADEVRAARPESSKTVPDTTTAETENRIAESPLIQAAFCRAHELAVELSADRVVASEHLLLSLLQLDAQLRARMERSGLDHPRLERLLGVNPVSALSLDEPLALAPALDSSRAPGGAGGFPAHERHPPPFPALNEETEAARIFDAAANRSREALRVIEDYCRFALDDAYLTGELKRLRHDLAALLAQLPERRLRAARETLRDAGTAIEAAGEYERVSLADAVRANWKRLQESLRSLEEFGKTQGKDWSRRLEQLRYRSYTLERAVLIGTDARRRLAHVRLCILVTGSACATSIEWVVKEAMAGGAEMIQLREKAVGDRDLVERARQVRRWTREAGGLFIMNDRPDIARLSEADGVHLGQDDLSVKDARRILGADALIGVSTHSVAQVEQAVLDGADYIGVGPTFPSRTKTFSEQAGLAFVRAATATTKLPAFAIGGIGPEDIEQVLAAGAERVAVSGAVCGAAEPRQIAAELRRRFGPPPPARSES